jgi:2-dehydro-3-deoxygalactonokinase
MAATEAGIVAVDWGTSSFRAARIDPAGRVTDRIAAPDGILKVGGDFAGTFRRHVGPWLEAARAAPPLVLLSGMIGSRNGWVEVPHVPCPAGPEALARGAAERVVDGARLLFVPGLSHVDADGVPDVMRGEEVQVFGALAGRGDADVILPGTHSKWVSVRSGVVTGFATYMTGELYAAILGHTIVGTLAEGDAPDEDAFAKGVARGHADPALSHAVFSARTFALAGQLPAAGVAAYLSGVLIGAEFAGGLARSDPSVARLVVGDAKLVARYSTAAARLGIALEPGPEDAAVLGLTALARSIGALA